MIQRMSVLVLVSCLLMNLIVLTACGGPDENKFSDITGNMESSAAEGSLNTIQGKYYEGDSTGNYVVFCEKGEGVTSQHGKYEINEDGISLSYDASEISMNYTISVSKSDKNQVTLKNGDIELNCTYKAGTAGLHKAEGAFTGTYSVDDGTDFVFKEDGTFRQVRPFKYVVDNNKLTETFDDSEVTFTWKESDGKILLKIDKETVQTLVPAK